MHVYYRRGEVLADQVHTYHTYGYKNDPLRQPKSYRCLKTAPLFRDLRSTYAISTAGGAGENPDKTITLRVFTDMGTEHVFNRVPVSIANGVAVIHGDKLLKQIGPDLAKVWRSLA